MNSSNMYYASALIVGFLVTFGIATFVFKDSTSKNFSEPFVGTLPSMRFKTQRMVANPNDRTLFYSTPGFDSFTEPRFQNNDLNSQINWPKNNNYNTSAVPANPVGYDKNYNTSAVPANPVGYDKNCDSCHNIQSDFIQRNETQLFSDNEENETNENETNENENPETETVIIDRLIFANRNSQLRAMGDPIRGDLPIVPNPPGWFTPSVSPQIDLQRGALNILAGQNEAATRLSNLLSYATDGLDTMTTPLDVSRNAYVSFGNRGNDVRVTAFP